MKFLEKKKEKIEFKVPSKIQDCIPVQRIYKDGIFYLGKNNYSKTYKFTDVNYVTITTTNNVKNASLEEFESDEANFYFLVGTLMFLYLI